MELRWGYVCADVEFNGPAATITGIGAGFKAPASGPIVPPFPLRLAMRLYASAADGVDNHVLRLVMTDDKDEPCSEPTQKILPFSFIAEGYPLFTGVRIRLSREPTALIVRWTERLWDAFRSSFIHRLVPTCRPNSRIPRPYGWHGLIF